MPSIKKQREDMIRSGGLDENALLGSSYKGNRASWIVSSNIPMALDAASLCERVADEVLEAHRVAIDAGLLADGGGPQPALDPHGASGRAAAKGERPPQRGVTATRAFPVGLSRTAVRFSGARLASGRRGTRARIRIQANPGLRGWLARELARGVEYFKVGGAIAALVQRTLLEWADAEVLAKVEAFGPRERRAPKQGPKLPPMQGPRQQKPKPPK